MRSPGELLQGKYRLARLIGEGGMGEVYEAVHEGIGKRVAVKFLIGDNLGDRLAVARFQREAQAAAAIGHHGIIDVHDIGVADDGAHFLVMEYLEGQPLSRHLEARGRLSPSRTAFVACQVLSALDAAHAKGIVHRDLKPDNVFLEDVGRDVPEVKLLDFGISKIMDQGIARESITMTGAVLGTPFYMSPEQARGDGDLDHRIDLYAMGVILYECLTGRVPFAGRTYNQVLAMILTADLVPPSRIQPDVPDRLNEIVVKALDRDPAGRHETAEAMLGDLLPFVDPHLVASISLSPGLRSSADRPSTSGSVLPTLPTVVAQPENGETPGAGASGERVARLDLESPAAPRRRRWLLLALAGALFALASGLGFALHRLSGSAGRGVSVAEATAAASEPGAVADAAPSRDPEPEPVARAERGDGGEAAEPPPSIRLEIAVDPADAQVLLDGAAVLELPFAGQVPRDGRVHRIRVEAPGHEPWSGLLSFDRDRSVRVALRRRVPAGARPAERPSGEPAPQPAGARPRDDPWRDAAAGGRPDGPARRDDPWRD